MARKLSEGSIILLKLMQERHPVGITRQYHVPVAYRGKIGGHNLAGLHRAGLIYVDHKGIYKLTKEGLGEGSNYELPKLNPKPYDSIVDDIFDKFEQRNKAPEGSDGKELK